MIAGIRYRADLAIPARDRETLSADLDRAQRRRAEFGY
jgi:hypothetical protein